MKNVEHLVTDPNTGLLGAVLSPSALATRLNNDTLNFTIIATVTLLPSLLPSAVSDFNFCAPNTFLVISHHQKHNFQSATIPLTVSSRLLYFSLLSQ